MSGTVRALGRPNDRFTIVSNDLVRDTELKATPFRVAVYVMGHTEDFVLTQESIGRALKLDRGTVRKAMVALGELGYLFRVPVHSASGRQPDDLYISQERMTLDQWRSAVDTPRGKTPHGKSPRGETPQRKEINSKKTNRQEEQPSGRGDAAAPSATESDPSPEEDMTRAAALDQPGLFDAPVIEKPKRKDRPKPVGSPAVVAAFVESYVEHHGGRRPLGSDLGKIGRDAKLIMSREEATEDELVAAATRMGRGEWANLPQELKFARRATRGPGVVHPPLAHSAPAWAELEERTRVDMPDLDEAEFNEIFGVKA